jgi:hypothetical protein
MACLFVGDSPVTADLHCITVVVLVGRHEFDPAVRWTGFYGQAPSLTSEAEYRP